MTNLLYYKIEVCKQNQGLRLDKLICQEVPDLSRNRVHSLLESSAISLFDKEISNRSYKVKEGDVINISIPELQKSTIEPANIPLDILYEDEHLLVVNKPYGMSSHPGAGTPNDTLVNALLYHCKDNLSGIGGVERPGIVHRLDKDTTGLMVVAKNDKAHRKLAKQIEKRELKRQYLTICYGVPMPMKGTIIGNIGRCRKNRQKMTVLKDGGKEAITHYKVKKIYGKRLASLVECQLETGRTHQIRVHLAHIGNSIVGDQTYGRSPSKKLSGTSDEQQEKIKSFKRQALHSETIAFIHPISKEPIELSCEPAEDMKSLMDVFSSLSLG